jgi:hypothetical protein
MPGLSNHAHAKDAAVCLRREIMHPMFIELFIETDADDLAEQDRRRRVRRSRRARPVMVIRRSGPS